MTMAGMYTSDILDLLTLTTVNAGGLAILVALVTLIGRRWIAPGYRCLMWALVALRLAIPFAPASPFSMQQVWRTDKGDANVNVHHGVWVEVSAAGDPLPPPEPAAFRNGGTQPQVTMAGILLTLWGIGAVASLLILGISTARFRRKLRQQATDGTPERRQLLEECRRMAGVRGHVRLLEVANLHSPALMGLLRPTVLLPADLTETFNEEQLRHVFLHELAHVKRCDVAVNGLLALLRILHWWNPLYWLVQSRLISEREQACDVQVLKCLGTAEGPAYGNTLLGVVARMKAPAEPGFPLPTGTLGLVTFLDRKSSLRRRLQSLKSTGRGESMVHRTAGALLTLALLIVGCSDYQATVTAEERSVFQLPVGTTWSLAPATALPDEELISIAYDMDDLIDHLTGDLGYTSPSARQLVEQLVETVCQSPPTAMGVPTDSVAPVFRWAGYVVTATESQHQVLTELLDVWQTHGPEQLSLEVRLITTSEDRPLPLGGGGRIISPGTGSLDPRPNIGSRGDELAMNFNAGARGRIISERRVPIYVQTLNEGRSQQTIQEVQSDARANIQMMPKVTLLNGQRATVISAVHRPFVTGLDDSSGSIQPQIEVIQDGLSLELSAVSDAGSGTIHLDCRLSLDTIVDVSETSMSRGEDVEPLTIQVPQVESQQYAASGELADGESLLISPLHADQRGQRLYAVISARRVTPDESTRDEE